MTTRLGHSFFRFLSRALSATAIFCVAAPAIAQNSLLPVEQPREPGEPPPEEPKDPPGPPMPPEAAALRFPPTRLGIRLEDRTRNERVLPCLVLVRDENSYLAALSAWRTDAEGILTRFPVLFDDGSYAAQQRIARFSRAFKPKRIVRFHAADPVFPQGNVERRAAIEAALGKIWGAEDGKPAELKVRWDAIHFTPPGVVVTWPDDPAWTAGLALAAAHGQPIVWMEPRGGALDDSIPLADLENFNVGISAQVESLGYEWKAPGDELETLALCANMPARADVGDDAPLNERYRATTDVIGRNYKVERRIKASMRWAWAAQIAGDAPSATHDAMCALFINWWYRGWLVDGYNSSAPWVMFDLTTAGQYLETVGMPTVVDDQTDGVRLEQLRRRAAGFRVGSKEIPYGARGGMGVSAGFVAFNALGNADSYFVLPPDDARSTDLPIMHRPFAAYFVQPWSAARWTKRESIAGMSRERGAFAFIGSVEKCDPDIKTLSEEERNRRASVFVMTPTFARRMGGRAPWAALSRPDAPPWEPWKIAVYGDPLLVMGLLPERPDEEPDLPGLIDVADELAAALRARDFPSALRSLGLLGRDVDAQNLLGTLIKGEAVTITPEIALAGINAAFIAGDFESLMICAFALRPIMEDQDRVQREHLAEIRDMVWHACWPLQNALSLPEADLLAHFLRPECLVRDTEEAAATIARFTPKLGTRRDIIERARTLTKDEAIRDELRRMLR